DSWFLLLVVLVDSSTNCAVNKDSNNPTIATERAVGKMILNVSTFIGTFGILKEGKSLDILPKSPNICTFKSKPSTIIVITIIEIMGAGIFFVTLGIKKIMAIPSTPSTSNRGFPLK